jgi:hypothetical protein
MKNGDKFVNWGGMDEKCDCCEKPATWRLRHIKSGNVVAAACKEHKTEVQTSFHAWQNRDEQGNQGKRLA